MGLSALLIGLGTVVILTSLVVAIWTVICNWVLFTKFGEPGWKGIIPYYNTYVQMYYTWDIKYFWIYLVSVLGYGVVSLIGVGDDSNALMLLISVTLNIASIVMQVLIYYHLALSFGYGFGFTVGLCLLPVIFLPILAFGSNNRYLGNPAYTNNDMNGYNRYY